ncbi:hypothetical protein JAB8_00730 [Janthinobacterium sp. HH106]|uniref:HEPN domain-containing protein n=1 Tax=Janthinobacterium sp. HH106 TaxID=1537278 RepID=UPI0008932254|nr:HEPN domain-containing protein [Janthinobacterium sp. HH106]OEZ93923.1 hypothetical protein JAB8_00730 [Janthinobacterium sp. HH106]
MVSVEYLAIMDKQSTFCDSIISFNKFLQVDSSIVINGGKIHFKESFVCDYKIHDGDVTGRNQHYFHVLFKIDSDADGDLIKFSEFLKIIRGLFSRINAEVETLWDDISFCYSKKAYTIIHQVENLMRKLISNFMLVKIGTDWVVETSPPEINDVINKGKRSSKINVLHNLDFIHLAHFLIKPYTKTGIAELYSGIKAAESTEDLEKLKSCLPESNWNRYFSSLVSCDDTFLQKRWDDLYIYRCIIAHNAILNKSQFDRVLEISNELNETLINALSKLPQVTVPESEVKDVVERVNDRDKFVSVSFEVAWRKMEALLELILIKFELPISDILTNCRVLELEGVFTNEETSIVEYLIDFRGRYYYEPDNNFEKRSVDRAIRFIGGICDSLEATLNSINENGMRVEN